MSLFRTPRSEPIQVRDVNFTVEFSFAHPAATVWERLRDPEVHLHDYVVFKGRVQGAPMGVGELTVRVHEGIARRHVHVTEILEYDEGRRLVTRELPNHDPGTLESETETVVDPLDDQSCVVRVRSFMRLRGRLSTIDQLAEELERQGRTGLEKLAADLGPELNA